MNWGTRSGGAASHNEAADGLAGIGSFTKIEKEI